MTELETKFNEIDLKYKREQRRDNILTGSAMVVTVLTAVLLLMFYQPQQNQQPHRTSPDMISMTDGVSYSSSGRIWVEKRHGSDGKLYATQYGPSCNSEEDGEPFVDCWPSSSGGGGGFEK